MGPQAVNRRELILGAGAGLALAACDAKTDVTQSLPPQINMTDMTPDKVRAALSGFAVNAESWWANLPFEERFAAAAEAGFSHVEFWFISSWDRDARALASQIKPTGLKVSQIVGDAPALGEAGTRELFLDNMKRAIEEAKILKTDIVTITGHQNVEGVDTSDALKRYSDHVAASVSLWEDARVYCAIEPFNPYNHPGHFINGSADAIEICRSINSPYVKLNWDLFHMQRTEGNVIDNLKKGADQICYMQMADSPDRHQPGTGEMDYVNIINTARAVGYERPIGLELWAKDSDYDLAIADILRLSMALN